MSLPASREEFAQYCLRRVGAPVIQIAIDDDQVDDRVSDALQYFTDYHMDATQKQYYKYQVQAEDITNQYITLPENIIGVVDLFPVGTSLSTTNLFNIRYQIALNDLYDLTNVTMVPYYQAMQHIQFLEQLLVGLQPIRFNRHSSILNIDMDWGIVNVGDFLVVVAYQIIDPDTYTSVWSDRWLLRYGTALIKRQWGENMLKYTDVPLPGGNKFNAQKIYDDAVREIEKLESEMLNSFSIPMSMMIG